MGATAVQVRTWVRVVLAYLAVTDLVVGLWGVIDPEGWFSDFPGAGHAWVAGFPPYNRHLSVDAAAGFLAVGVGLAVAALWAERRPAQLACAAALAHGVPHVLFHLGDSGALDDADAVSSVATLATSAVLALVVLVALTRPTRTTTEA
jgi:hypothetical protein